MVFVYVLMAVLGAAVAVFALQNLDPVVIRFVTWRIEGAPLALVILLSVVVGIVLTALRGVVRYWRLRARIRQLEHRLAEAEAARPPAVTLPPPESIPPPRPDLAPPR